MRSSRELYCGLAVALFSWAHASPISSQADRILGSSFGTPGQNATFDYVIVGGGNAGLAIATRLAEQQSGSVAVIEAGTFYEISSGNVSEVPALNGVYTSKGDHHDNKPMIDWGYVTTPQENAYHTKVHYPVGKCLGGSSARNHMVYHRASRSSYQMWADLVQDDSYTFDELLPYFEKSIKFTPPNMKQRFANSTPDYDDAMMGSGKGPLSVSFSNCATAFGTWAVKGLAAIGISAIPGFQSGSLLGQSYSMSTINATTMMRDSSETSFLRKALGAPNYTVYQMAMAKKILFGPGKRATGVLVDSQGMKYTLTARKEVIVSAGVFGSPQLLMVSGVGPASTLQQLDIPIVADRPGVGQNLQDHIYFGPSYRVNGRTASALEDPAFAAKAAEDFREKATGLYAATGVDVLGWEKVPEDMRISLSDETRHHLQQYPADWPEIEYISINAYLGYQSKSVGNDPNDGYNYASLAVALVTPKSRGSVSIASADNDVHPVINPNYFGDRTDIEVMIAGYRRVREFWNSTAMKPFLVGEGEAFPGLDVSTDEQLEDVIKKSFDSVKHASCTCAMGLADDEMAVVDTQAKVYGVKGLRVVDASIFPFLLPGHPMATIYALAEKIAANITGHDVRESLLL